MTEEELKAKVEAELSLKFAQDKAVLEQENASLKASAEKYAAFADMFEGIEDMRKAVSEFQDKQTAIEAKEKQYNDTLAKVRKDEIHAFASDLVKSNKILPFQQVMVEEILFAIPEDSATLEFTQPELFGLKEKMTLGETVRALFSSNPDMGMLKEFTSQTKVTADPEELRVELEKKYMDEHKVDYGTAQQAISKARPDLYGIQ
jgi:hypothetical protein